MPRKRSHPAFKRKSETFMTINHPNFGAIGEDRVIIFDTTLRDGEQAPGFSMNIDEKLRMARHLEALNVDILEAGFPIASEGDFLAVQYVSKEIRTPVIAGLARSVRKDIDRCAKALEGAD